MSKVTVVIKEPGKSSYAKDIDDELSSWQREVGGLLEIVREPMYQRPLSANEEFKKLLKGLHWYIDEEGKFKRPNQPNCMHPAASDIIVGTIVVWAPYRSKAKSLTPQQIRAVNAWFDEWKNAGQVAT